MERTGMQSVEEKKISMVALADHSAERLQPTQAL